MTSRNLLIIAAVPGFRANTKLEREDNNQPVTKAKTLNLYADLVLTPKGKVAAKSRLAQMLDQIPAKSLQQQRYESIPNTKLSKQRFYEEYTTNPIEDMIYNPNTDTVLYRGRKYTHEEAYTTLPREVFDRMEKLVRDQSKKDRTPFIKLS